MKSILLSTFFIFIISLNSFSQIKKDTIEKIATEYMKAYGNWDFDKMKSFYSEDIHFEDPTGSEAFNQPMVFNGKENVHTFFKNVFKGKFKNDKPPYVNFIIDKKIISGSFIIINSTFECLLPTSWFKKNSDEKILISIPFVTILEFEKELIKKHTDYGDYSKYNTQITVQLKD